MFNPTLTACALHFPLITKLPPSKVSPANFLTGLLSPVIKLSFASMLPSIKTQSAQIWLPLSKNKISSLTTFSTSTCISLLSLKAVI